MTHHDWHDHWKPGREPEPLDAFEWVLIVLIGIVCVAIIVMPIWIFAT
jgi:hypothetical protein